MDRPTDLVPPPEPPPPGSGLGPVGDWIGGEWPTQAADRIESVIGNVRRKTTGPAMVASRAVVYGIVAIVFATSLSPNSYSVCSRQMASRSKYGPLRCCFKKVRLRVCAIPALLLW